jgi:60 kDa SS-A/Ro ribonucleoprotein
MGKFDAKVSRKPVKTTNHVGAVAYKKTANFELISTLLTSFVEDTYYKGKDSTLKGLSDILKDVDPLFAAKAAIYARTKFGMRSISHAVASELAKHISGKDWAKDFYNAIVYRPDDILEILAYHFGKKQKLSKAMQKGLAASLGKFDAYQLAKYKGENKSIKLVDAVNILHPTSTDHNGTISVDKDTYWAALSDKMKKAKNVKLGKLKATVKVPALDALMLGLLKSEGTWEAELSAAGQKATNDEQKEEFKKDAWIKLIETKKIGYFALLRNLRNIIEQAPEAVDGAIEMLTNQKLIKNSLVLPFRFLSAYESISAMSGGSLTARKKSIFENGDSNAVSGNVIEKMLKAIDDAAKLSVANIPLFDGKTIILSDNSGSMTGDRGGSSRLSTMTERKTSDVANLFAVLCWLRSENTAIGLFGDRLIEPKLDRSKGVFDNFNLIDKEKEKCGGSTEAGIFDMFRKLIKEKIIANRIVIFSDCQIGDRCQWYGTGGSERANDFNKLFQEYRKINPDFMCYSIDLKGYSTTVFDKGVTKLAGMSEKIFELMAKIETDKHSLVKEIEQIEFTNAELVEN